MKLWELLRDYEKKSDGWDDSEKGRAKGLFNWVIEQLNVV